MSHATGFGGFSGRLGYTGGGGGLTRSIDFTAGTASRASINFLGSRSIDDPLTFVGWIKTPVAAAAGFTVWNSGQFGTRGWSLLFNSTGAAINQVQTVVKQNGVGNLNSEAAVALSHDTWYHMVMTYAGDAATVMVYIDGVNVPLTDTTSTLTPGSLLFYQSFPAANAGWYLGYHQVDASAFQGHQLNVGIYNAFFSGALVTEDYNGGNTAFDRLAGTAAADLIAWYPPLDSDTDPNTQISDASGNANHIVGESLAFSTDVP